MKSEHVEIRGVTDGVDVLADDCEVFDYLDDVLIERGLAFAFIREEERDGRCFHVMHFGADVSAEQMAAVLDEIPAEEVERIWRLNNSMEAINSDTSSSKGR
jgi:hypothetical protein